MKNYIALFVCPPKKMDAMMSSDAYVLERHPKTLQLLHIDIVIAVAIG